MLKEMTIAIAAGAVSGIVYVAPLFGSLLGLLLINFTHLPLFLAGLSMGVTTVAVAAAAGTVVVVAIAGIAGAIPFALAFAVPAVAVVRQTLLWRTTDDGGREWYPPGMALTLLVSYGAAAFVAAAALMAMQAQGIQAVTQGALEANLALVLPSLPAEQRTTTAAEWSAVFPALVVVSWLLTVVVNGAIAQATLARAGRNLRPSPEFSRVVLPDGLALALAVSALLWLTPIESVGYAGKALTIIFAAPYFLQGLAVTHHLSRVWGGRAALVAFYVVLSILGWSGFALVSGLGFIEQWAGLRRRFAARGPKDGKS